MTERLKILELWNTRQKKRGGLPYCALNASVANGTAYYQGSVGKPPSYEENTSPRTPEGVLRCWVRHLGFYLTEQDFYLSLNARMIFQNYFQFWILRRSLSNWNLSLKTYWQVQLLILTHQQT